MFGIAAAAPADAAWQRASSDHFVIYADDDPAELRKLATRLEKFDAAVRLGRSMADPKLGDGNRVTIFAVKDTAAVKALMRAPGSNVAGFYTPRYWGSIAVVPRRLSFKSTLEPQTIFFHEYAHHLMFSDIKTPIPSWLVEGFAEFMSTADINDDGSVGLGAGAVHRASTLKRPLQKIPLSTILSGERMRDGFEHAALYARGWLLAHYLTFSPSRRGQIEAYLEAIARGQPQLEAARGAFGDINQLDRELDDYLKADKLPYLTLPAARLAVGDIKVEPLAAGAEEYLPLMMRIRVGVRKDKRPDLAVEARRLAAAFPDDALMAMTLAEAELYNENFTAADAAADRAVALAPDSAEALMLKGRAVIGRAKAGDKAVTFANARGWFNRANRLDPENPEPLVSFYRSFIDEKVAPTANAVEALHYAADLAPFDMGLRLTSAERYLADGKAALARARLVPVAYNPHGGKLAEKAAAIIARIDAGDIGGAKAAAGTDSAVD